MWDYIDTYGYEDGFENNSEARWEYERDNGIWDNLEEKEIQEED